MGTLIVNGKSWTSKEKVNGTDMSSNTGGDGKFQLKTVNYMLTKEEIGEVKISNWRTMFDENFRGTNTKFSVNLSCI